MICASHFPHPLHPAVHTQPYKNYVVFATRTNCDETNSSPQSFVNYLAHLNCPTAGDSNFIKINTLNSRRNPAYPKLLTGVVPRRFLGPFVVALTDLPPRAPTVINKIVNDCIVLFLRHVQRLYHFSKIQLSTANLIRIRLFGPLKL
jgi:hypothetical protein